MNVQEFIKEADLQHVSELAYEADHSAQEHDKEAYQAHYRGFIEALLRLAPKQDTEEHIMIGVQTYYDDSPMQQDVNLYKKDEITEHFHAIQDFEQDAEHLLKTAKTAEDIWPFLMQTADVMPQSYAYEFSEWEDILGWEVDFDSMQEDIDGHALAILEEMSFNGFSRESQDERRRELDESIAETERIMALPKEEQDKHLVSIDKLFDDFGLEDDRTEEEKRVDELQMAVASLRCRLSYYKALLRYTTIQKNKVLVQKYPFLYPKNAWTGKKVEPYDFSYTELDGWPAGWVRAFGEQFAEDLWMALSKTEHAEEYFVQQVKEKYGSARWYDNFETDEMKDVVSKYEHISTNTCIFCGSYPVNIIDDGWISPMCYDCFAKAYRRRWKNTDKDLSDGALKTLYQKYTVESGQAASPIAKYRIYDKNGQRDYELDCSDIISRMTK